MRYVVRLRLNVVADWNLRLVNNHKELPDLKAFINA